MRNDYKDKHEDVSYERRMRGSALTRNTSVCSALLTLHGREAARRARRRPTVSLALVYLQITIRLRTVTSRQYNDNNMRLTVPQ